MATSESFARSEMLWYRHLTYNPTRGTFTRNDGIMKSKSTRALYDEIGEKYLRNRSSAFNDYTELPTVMSLIRSAKGKLVLDAGCGPGKHAKDLIAKGASVTAIDVSEKMVNLAREYCDGRGEFFRGSFEHASFTPVSFDLIIASLSIIYSRNISKVFNNFGRWLKPGGQLIFSIYHPVRYHEKLKGFDFSKSKKVWISLHGYDVTVFNYYHPLEKYFTALHENGFAVSKFIEPVLSRKYKGWQEDAYRIPRVIVMEAKRQI